MSDRMVVLILCGLKLCVPEMRQQELHQTHGDSSARPRCLVVDPSAAWITGACSGHSPGWAAVADRGNAEQISPQWK